MDDLNVSPLMAGDFLRIQAILITQIIGAFAKTSGEFDAKMIEVTNTIDNLAQATTNPTSKRLLGELAAQLMATE